MADQGIITTKPKANGGKEYSITKWFDNRTCRFTEFNIGRFAKQVDALNEDEAAEAIKEPPKQNNDGWQQIGFDTHTPFEDGGEDLPF